MVYLFTPWTGIYLAYFIFACLVAWTLPGIFFLKKTGLSFFQKIIFGTIIGMVLWGWQAFIFGYLGLRNLTFLYLSFFLILDFFYLKKINFRLPSIKKANLKIDKLTLLIFILGTAAQSFPMLFNGIKTKKGLFFCCGNSGDSLWHISLINSLVERFPPFQPGMFGVEVTNYHYWSNLVIAELIRVFKLPLLPAFLYSLIFVSAFLGLSAIVFCQVTKLNKTICRWFLFFLYFGGDFAYLVTFFSKGQPDFLVGSLEDGSKFLLNPPRAYSIVILFIGLGLLYIWLKKRNLTLAIIIALLFGSLAGFKIYTGIFAISGLFFLGTYKFLKKNYLVALIGVVSLLLSAIVFLPANRNSGGLFFVGLWRFNDFIVHPHLNLSRLKLAEQTFAYYNNTPRVIQYQLIFVFLYFISTFSTKLIGFFQTKKSLSCIPKEINIFLIPGLFLSLFLGSFFLQKSGGANTFNFIVTVFIIGSLYSALACFYWQNKIKIKSLKYLFIILIIILTLPRVVFENATSFNRAKNLESFTISESELKAFDFLATNTKPGDNLLVDQEMLKNKISPYIAFMSEKRIFLTGTDIMEMHNVNYTPRAEITKKITSNLSGGGSSYRCNTATENNIKYLLSERVFQQGPFLDLVFEDKKIKIYEFK